ncbi:hypothetical protein WJX79_001885 [Trebouxia sp. C0005]
MGDEEATWDTETECAKIARFLVSAREHFDLASRQSAQQALESNLAKAKQAASLRQQQAGPLSSFSPLSAARGCGVGRQMYYTDEIGETIPLSDSDEEQDSDTESLDGVQREADMFLLSKAVSQFGARPEVVRIAASMMRAKRATVQTRMQSLAAAVPEGPAIQSEHQKLDVMVAKFTKSFCRRCRIFNCFAHTGPHTKPHQRRPAKPVISSSAACTKKCFKTCISADAGLALASTTADLLPPQASGNAMTMGGTPTLTPLRIPSGKPMAAKSSPEAPNTGSASDPIEIDISSDDDQVPAPAWDWPGSAPNHLASGQNEVDTTPNRRGSAQGKLGSMQGSPTDLYVSLSDYSNTPQKTPITVRGRNTVQGSHAPLAHSAKGSRPPLSDSVKGSPAPFSGPIAVTPDPLQDPLSNHVKGNSGPFSLTRKGTPASLKGLPVSPPDALLESVRSAATSSALLSVPRRGRVILAESSPLHAMAALDDGADDGAGPSGSQGSHPDAGWTPFEVSVFDKAAEMFSGDSCKMARLVGTKSCQEVYARLQKVGLPAALAGAATLTGPTPQQGRGRWRKAKPAKKKMKSTGQAWHVVRKRMKKSKGQDETAPQPYQPCQCKEDCKEGCPCLNDGHFCEKFCACGPKCGSRFQGCVCKGGCKNKGCPCMAADRECDPDLCMQCQWSISGQKPPGSVDCHNMKLRLRQHKRVAMGLSNVAGWGAFAQEDIRRNEFVAEYTGELINHREADRRGKAYDRDSNTYLFDLNDEWVIDAKHRGNKMRFANHSNEANCRVQIMMVDGDHRVAIFAAKDIPTGTELLYDYGKKFGKV